jgi:ABC-2 type transport system permease protein
MQNWLDIYKALFKAEFALKTQYRASIFIWFVGMVSEPLVYLAVWNNVVAAQGVQQIGGFTSSDFASYYIALMFIRQATANAGIWKMGQYIREGALSGLLLRPLHPIHGDLVESFAFKIWTTLFLIPFVPLLALLFDVDFTPVGWSLLAFVPALVLASFLRFFIHWTLGMTAFWTTRIDAIVGTYLVTQIFFAGRLAPLSLMPQFIQTISWWLPFRWIEPFTVDLALGRLTPQEALLGFVMQVLWIGLCWQHCVGFGESRLSAMRQWGRRYMSDELILRAEDALKSEWLETYKRHRNVLHDEIVALNTNLFIIENIEAFPFDLLVGPPADRIFWQLTKNALIISSMMIIWRIAVDKNRKGTKPKLTLNSFHDDILNNLRDESAKNYLISRLNAVKFEERMEILSEKVRFWRHNYLKNYPRIPLA